MPDNTFKFNVDDERPDRASRGRLDAIRSNKGRIDRLSRRITVISLFITVLMLAVIALGYWNIRNQFMQARTSETTKLEEISKSLESRFAVLSEKFAKFDESMTEKVFPMDEIFLTLESTNASLKDQLAKNRESIKKISTAKVEQKALETALATVKKSLQLIQRDIGTLGHRVKALDDKFTAEQEKLRAALEKQSAGENTLREELTGLLSKKPDRDVLESGLREQEKAFQSSIDVLMDNLKDKQRQLDSLRGHFRNLESELEKIKESRVSRTPRRRRSKPKPSASSKPASSSTKKTVPSSSKTPSSGSVTLKPGTIIEQDIQ